MSNALKVSNSNLKIKKPSDKKILENILNGFSEFSGTCWNPVKDQKDGVATSYSLMLNQCPQACGDVWRITIADKDVADWLTKEINNRRSASGMFLSR